MAGSVPPALVRSPGCPGTPPRPHGASNADEKEGQEKATRRKTANVTVGVGIMFAHNPLHGSGQAGFPHPALALGDDAHAAQGIGMTDGRQRQPASDEAPHAVPEYAAVLAAPRQRTMPEPSHLEAKKSQRRVVHGHSV